jgi:hypothetical protein
MVPFTLHGLTHAIGWFPATSAPPQDLSALLAGPAFLSSAAAVLAFAAAAWRFPYPPLAALLALSGWIVAMDAAPVAFGAAISWEQRAIVSVLVGTTVLSLALAFDRRLLREFAGWLYRAGAAALAFGLVTVAPSGAAAALLHLALQAALVALGLLVRRRALVVAGALALAVDGGRLAATQASGASLVAFAVAVGLAALAGGASYPWLERRLGGALRSALPRALAGLLPPPLER